MTNWTTIEIMDVVAYSGDTDPPPVCSTFSLVNLGGDYSVGDDTLRSIHMAAARIDISSIPRHKLRPLTPNHPQNHTHSNRDFRSRPESRRAKPAYPFHRSKWLVE